MVYSLSQRGSWPLRIQFRRYDSLNFLRRFNAAEGTHHVTGSGAEYRTGDHACSRASEVSFGVPKLARVYIPHKPGVGACNENRRGRFLCHVFLRTPSREFPALLAVCVFFYSNHSYLKIPMISGAQRRITLEIVAHAVVLQPPIRSVG